MQEENLLLVPSQLELSRGGVGGRGSSRGSALFRLLMECCPVVPLWVLDMVSMWCVTPATELALSEGVLVLHYPSCINFYHCCFVLT